MRRALTAYTSPQTVFVVGSDALEGTQANSGTVQWVFEVPSGAVADFAVYADVFTQPFVTGVPASAGTILGTMTAEYSPFGSTSVFAPTSDGGFDGFGQPRTDVKRSLPR